MRASSSSSTFLSNTLLVARQLLVIDWSNPLFEMAPQLFVRAMSYKLGIKLKVQGISNYAITAIKKVQYLIVFFVFFFIQLQCWNSSCISGTTLLYILLAGSLVQWDYTNTARCTKLLTFSPIINFYQRGPLRRHPKNCYQCKPPRRPPNQGRNQDLGLGGGGVSRRGIWGPLMVPSGSRGPNLPLSSGGLRNYRHLFERQF